MGALVGGFEDADPHRERLLERLDGDVGATGLEVVVDVAEVGEPDALAQPSRGVDVGDGELSCQAPSMELRQAVDQSHRVVDVCVGACGGGAENSGELADLLGVGVHVDPSVDGLGLPEPGKAGYGRRVRGD
ncbi:hypothetical protein [Brevibacterium casei]|uniref:hypothetical protein n=1 Tax=Brevibacterium casei TaxID=33889 RepID=UPI0020D0A1FE|nr:hypothetical protein [Brevibacterium casei]